MRGRLVREGLLRQLIGDIAFRVARRLGAVKQTTWRSAQTFELRHAVVFMEGPLFQQAVAKLSNPDARMSSGYREESILREFFNGSETQYEAFVEHIRGKSVLDVGPCVISPLSMWDVAKRRIVIEPLYDEVVEYQIAQFGQTCFPNIDTAFSSPAEKRIPELLGAIDGAIYVRNCIDHSPQWPFILSNLAAYAAPGAALLLWNDLLHPPEYLAGHFDITDDALAFRHLLEAFGFRIEHEFSIPGQGLLNYGCRAVRA